MHFELKSLVFATVTTLTFMSLMTLQHGYQLQLQILTYFRIVLRK